MPKFDSESLYERFYDFALSCQRLTLTIPKNIYNIEYSKQLIRSSASVPGNYIEAIESLGKKDFVYRLKVCRKEARESLQWLRLIQDTNKNIDVSKLIKEADELIRILTSSIINTEKGMAK